MQSTTARSGRSPASASLASRAISAPAAPAIIAISAPEAELHTTGRFVDHDVYRGRAGLARYWAEIHEEMEELSLSISDLRAIGDKVFLAATGRGGGYS
jgi:hypothetical protein